MDWQTLPSLAALRAFDALARAGSLSGAGRQLNVTHAAIAQHLRALEAHFGLTLAERDGQKMRLTEAGRELATALGDGFDTIADGVTRLAQRNAEAPVTLTLTPTFAEAWLMPRIGGFWQAHPEIDLRLVPTAQVVDLKRDGIDLAIRFGDGHWPGLEVTPLSLDPFVVIAAPGLVEERRVGEGRGDEERVEGGGGHERRVEEGRGRAGLAGAGHDLSGFKWLHSKGANEHGVWARQIGIDYAQTASQEMPNNGMVLSAVRAGLGLSVQTRALVDPDLASGQLVALHEGDPGGLGYYLVTRPGVARPAVKVVMRWLRRTASLGQR